MPDQYQLDPVSEAEARRQEAIREAHEVRQDL